jgi:hypothetical protein
MLKRLFWIIGGMTAGILLTAGVASALAGSVHTSGAPSGHNVFDANTTTPGSPPAGTRDHGGWSHNGVFGRVTTVKGNTITLMTRNNQTVTVTVSSGTTYEEAGAKAALSDVHTGSALIVQGTSTGTSSYNATAIMIVAPSVGGRVTGVGSSSITVKTFSGSSQTILVDGSTKYSEAGQAGSLHDVTMGTRIEAEGTTTSGGQLRASVVNIQLPRVAGTVSKVSGATITISPLTGRFGAWAGAPASGTPANSGPTTVTTSSSTKYFESGTSSANASSIKVGSTIVAEGTLSADGKTLQAQRLTILPAGVTGRGGFFGHGRFNGPPGGFFGQGRSWGRSQFVGPSGAFFNHSNNGSFFDHGTSGTFSPGGTNNAPVTNPFSGNGANA